MFKNNFVFYTILVAKIKTQPKTKQNNNNKTRKENKQKTKTNQTKKKKIKKRFIVFEIFDLRKNYKYK